MGVRQRFKCVHALGGVTYTRPEQPSGLAARELLEGGHQRQWRARALRRRGSARANAAPLQNKPQQSACSSRYANQKLAAPLL